MEKIVINLKESMAENAKLSSQNFFWVGLISFLGHPLFWAIWTYVFPQEDSLIIRLTAAIVCMPLMLVNKWPIQIKRYIPFIWHFCLIYTLPFTFTFLLLKNSFEPIWVMSQIILFFLLLTFIYDFLLMSLCYVIGIFAGIILYLFFPNESSLEFNFLLEASPLLLFTIFGGFLFNFGMKKGISAQHNIVLEQQIKALNISKEKAHGIAHEMRNLMSGIQFGINTIQSSIFFRSLKLKEQILLSEQDIKNIFESLNMIHVSKQSGDTIINLLLKTITKEHIIPKYFTKERISSCISESVALYPYKNAKQRDRVSYRIEQDFDVFLEKSFFKYVIFNLIKNALFYTDDYPDSRITISARIIDNDFFVFVKDTGPGIPKDNLNSIFTGFMTSGKKGGTGLGLSFCKRTMNSFKGDITVDSKLGHWTEFKMSFPKLNEMDIPNKFIKKSGQSNYISKRVLVIDSNQFTYYGIKLYLSEHHILVEQAESCENINISKYDCIMTPSDATYNMLPDNIPQGIIIYNNNQSCINNDKVCSLQLDLKSDSLFETLRYYFDNQKFNQDNKSNFLKEINCILLVDDNEVNRIVTTKYLIKLGYQVDACESGQEAIKKANDIKYDLVFMDIEMPGMNGLEATKILKEKYPNLTIVMLTGNSDEKNRLKALACGAIGVLPKPITQSKLSMQIKQLTSRDDSS